MHHSSKLKQRTRPPHDNKGYADIGRGNFRFTVSLPELVMDLAYTTALLWVLLVILVLSPLIMFYTGNVGMMAYIYVHG